MPAVRFTLLCVATELKAKGVAPQANSCPFKVTYR